MVSRAFVLVGGAVAMYEIMEWQMASPEKAGLAMSASLSYKAVELAEKVPGVDYAVSAESFRQRLNQVLSKQRWDKKRSAHKWWNSRYKMILSEITW